MTDRTIESVNKEAPDSGQEGIRVLKSLHIARGT